MRLTSAGGGMSGPGEGGGATGVAQAASSAGRTQKSGPNFMIEGLSSAFGTVTNETQTGRLVRTTNPGRIQHAGIARLRMTKENRLPAPLTVSPVSGPSAEF